MLSYTMKGKGSSGSVPLCGSQFEEAAADALLQLNQKGQLAPALEVIILECDDFGGEDALPSDESYLMSIVGITPSPTSPREKMVSVQVKHRQNQIRSSYVVSEEEARIPLPHEIV